MKEKVKDYKALAFSVLRFYPTELKSQIEKKGLREDLLQEIDLACFLAKRENLDLKEASKFIQRCLYRFLVNYGFKRNRKEHYKYITEELFSDTKFLQKEVKNEKSFI